MRSEFEPRPLLCAFAALAAVLGSVHGLWTLLILLPIAVWCGRSWPAVLAGALLGFLLRFDPDPWLEPPTAGYAGRLVVRTMPERTLEGWRVEAQDRTGRFILAGRGPSPVIGDRVLVAGERSPASELVRGRGLAGRIDAVRVKIDPGWASPFWQSALKVRDALENRISRLVPGEKGGLLIGMSLGRRTELSQETLEAIRRSGGMHLIAASGMNVLIFAAIVGWLCSLAPMPPWTRWAVLAVILLGYGALVGFGMSIIRAIVMALAWQAAFVFRREPDAPSVWGLAGIVGLALEPAEIAGIGFWLSMTAVAGLVVFWESSPSFPLLIRGLVSGMVATLATAPLVAFWFGDVPWVGLLLDLLVVPLAAPIMAMVAAASILIGPAGPVGDVLLSWGAGSLAGFALRVMLWLGTQPWAVIPVPWYPAWAATAGYLPLLILWRTSQREA
ncbi:MAG: ComEC/Rec2 family competence protein [Fimbriimonadaceae bacterium]|nr:ComEC/Rec2 family competence protein [Fimbriimonadaceae bacterium]